MKQFAKHLFAAAMLSSAAMSTSVMAQQKIAVVDVQAIFEAMPQAIEIQANINAEFKDQIEEVQQLQRDVAFYTEQLQRESATMSETQITELQEKIIGLREDYTAKGQPLQQNLQRRANEERNKLLALIKQAIDKIAADKDYDLILNAGSASFAKQELDLSADVLEQVKKLN